jgi:hypothetical protein
MTLREKATNLAQQVREDAERRRDEAISTSDLGEWIRAEDHLRKVMNEYHTDVNPQVFEWIWKDAPDAECSVDQMIEHFDRGYIDKPLEKEVKFVEGAYSELKKMEDKEGHVKVALRRIRKKNQRDWTNVVLAIFPEGSSIRDPSNNKGPYFRTGKINSREDGIVYYIATNPCAGHAVDDLYRMMKQMPTQEGDAGVFGYVPFVDFEDFHMNREPGLDHYKDPVTRKTKNKERYVSALIAGWYSNERRRFRISVALLEGR